jgi:hypothetical protein
MLKLKEADLAADVMAKIQSANARRLVPKP